jgi:hypothetical protein
MSTVQTVKISKTVTETWSSSSGPTLAALKQFIADCDAFGFSDDKVIYVSTDSTYSRPKMQAHESEENEVVAHD